MKGKVFGVAIVFALVFAMMAAVSCSSSPTTPAATATAVGPGQTATAVAAAATATAAANIAATATAVAVANAAETGLYTFNSLNASQIAVWERSGAMTSPVWNTTVDAGHLSTGCLQVNYSATGTQAASSGEIKFTVPWDNGTADQGVINLTGSTVSVWLNVPATFVSGEYALQFNVQSVSPSPNVWTGFQKWNTITTTGWTQFTFNLATDGTPPGAWDITRVNQIIIQVMKTADGSSNYTGTLLFDGINW